MIKELELTEKQIQNYVISLFSGHGYYVWRNNSGFFSHDYTTKAGIQKHSRIRAGIRGSADIIGISPHGRFVAFEIKRKGKKPTPEQEAFLHEINLRGGFACVIDSIDLADKIVLDITK